MGRKKCGLLIGMIIVWWMMCFHEQVVKAADYERQDIDSSQEKCEEEGEENRRRINEVCSELTNVLERYVTDITLEKTERIVMEEREEGNPAEIEISPAERIDRVVAIDYEFIEKKS